MKKAMLTAAVVLLALGLSACDRLALPIAPEPETTVQTTVPTAVTTLPPTTKPLTTEPPVTEPEHSALYIPGLSVEDVIVYFNEVCLDGEFINSGDPGYVQKWVEPVFYTLEGDYTQEDTEVLNAVSNWLNHLEGFPGLIRAEDADGGNLRICFCTEQEMVDLLGSNLWNMDGGVTFWYNGDNEVYEAIVCCRSDIEQTVRNSVIIEEIYNGLGPIQDTALRPDSIIYSEYTFPQWMSEVDELILQLLYHPEIKTGMNAEQCAQVIRKLYY